jgi:hypothetical protein
MGEVGLYDGWLAQARCMVSNHDLSRSGSDCLVVSPQEDEEQPELAQVGEEDFDHALIMDMTQPPGIPEAKKACKFLERQGVTDFDSINAADAHRLRL